MSTSPKKNPKQTHLSLSESSFEARSSRSFWTLSFWLLTSSISLRSFSISRWWRWLTLLGWPCSCLLLSWLSSCSRPCTFSMKQEKRLFSPLSSCFSLLRVDRSFRFYVLTMEKSTVSYFELKRLMVRCLSCSYLGTFLWLWSNLEQQDTQVRQAWAFILTSSSPFCPSLSLNSSLTPSTPQPLPSFLHYNIEIVSKHMSHPLCEAVVFPHVVSQLLLMLISYMSLIFSHFY